MYRPCNAAAFSSRGDRPKRTTAAARGTDLASRQRLPREVEREARLVFTVKLSQRLVDALAAAISRISCHKTQTSVIGTGSDRYVGIGCSHALPTDTVPARLCAYFLRRHCGVENGSIRATSVKNARQEQHTVVLGRRIGDLQAERSLLQLRLEGGRSFTPPAIMFVFSSKKVGDMLGWGSLWEDWKGGRSFLTGLAGLLLPPPPPSLHTHTHTHAHPFVWYFFSL